MRFFHRVAAFMGTILAIYRKAMTETSDSPQKILFQLHLTPHRSLSRRAFRRIMCGAGAFSLTIATGTYLAGAWPVFGFMGIDVLLVYLALRASYRSAKVTEIVRLDERALTVERRDARGYGRRWSFQPAWLRVELAEPILPATPVVLRSHGQSLPIAAFLSPAERRHVADEIARALARWRQPGPLFD